MLILGINAFHGDASAYRERLRMLFGSFRYADAGLLDRLHLRFFNFHTAQELVSEAGFAVVGAHPFGGVPLRPFRRVLGRRAAWLDRVACRHLPNLFGWHIVVVGERREDTPATGTTKR